MGRQPRLARLHRPGAGVGLALLSGCANPISNLPFEEEAAFLAALPDRESFGAPRDLALAPLDGDPVLLAAKASASAWDGWAEGPMVLGQALIGREPDERTEVARRWRRIEVAAVYTGAALASERPRTVFVDGAVVRLEDGSFSVELSVAPDADAAADAVATGRRDGDTVETAWDLDALFAVYGVEGAPGPLSATAVHGEDGARHVEAGVGSGPTATTWTFADQDRMQFGADLALTADGLTWPATVDARQVAEDGGRAGGVVHRGTEDLAFDACWDGRGSPTWLGGDAGIAEAGDAALCPE